MCKMFSLVITAFLLGFIGSAHCIGMCGGIATLVVTSASPSRWHALLEYQVGRISVYVLLGTGAGVFAAVFDWTSSLLDAQRVLSTLAGLMVVLMGLHIAGWIPDPLKRITPLWARWTRIQSILRGPKRVSNRWRSVLIGIGNGFLPCGMVYGALALAVVAGNIGLAVMTMLAFGLGTVPAMFFAPALMRMLIVRWRQHAVSVVAVLMISVGVVTILRGLHTQTELSHEHGVMARAEIHSSY